MHRYRCASWFQFSFSAPKSIRFAEIRITICHAPKKNTCRSPVLRTNIMAVALYQELSDGSSFVEIDPLPNEICFVLVVEGTPRKDMVEVTIVVNVAKIHDCTCRISFSLSATAQV